MDADKEISTLKKDKIKSRNRGNLKELAEVCNYLGSKLTERGRYEEALEEHKEELSLSKKLKDDLGIAISHRCLGEVCAEMEEYSEALKNLKVYLEIAETLKNYVELQRAWTTLGRTYFMKGDLTNAEKAHSMAMKLTEKVKPQVAEKEYVDMKCRTYLNLALIYDQEDKVNEGCQFYMKAIQLATKFGLKETLHRCQNSLALFYQKLAYFPRAIKLLEEAITTARSLKSKVFICEYLLSKGHLLLLVKDYQGARTCFKKAYFTKSPVESDTEKAKRFLLVTTNVCKAFKALDRTETTTDKMKIYDKLGDLLSELEVYKIALEFYLEELECAKQLDLSATELATIHVSIAQTYLDDKQFEKAIQHFEEERKQRKGNVFEEVRTCLKIIEAKIGLRTPYNELEKLYESAIQLAAGDLKAKRKVIQDYKFYSLQEGNDENASRLSKALEDLGEEMDDESDVSSDEGCNLSDISDPSSESGDNEERDSTAEPRQPRSRIGSKLAKKNEMGETPLHRACIAGNYKEVMKLLEKGHPVDVRDHCGWLAIHEAANHGFHEIVELLIDHGADINDRGGEKCDGTTPLHDACSNAIPEVIKLLIRKGANVAALDNAGNTPYDCLRIWRQRVNELDVEEELVYKGLIEELELAMKKVGFDARQERSRPVVLLNSPERSKRPRNQVLLDLDTSPSNSPPRKRKETTEKLKTTTITLVSEVDFDDPDVAKEEYRNAISNLRRQKDVISGPKKAKDSSHALLDEDEYVRDWLEDDIGGKGNKEKSCRDLYHSKNLPTKYREPSCRSSPKSKFKPKRYSDERASKHVRVAINDAHESSSSEAEEEEEATVYEDDDAEKNSGSDNEMEEMSKNHDSSDGVTIVEDRDRERTKSVASVNVIAHKKHGHGVSRIAFSAAASSSSQDAPASEVVLCAKKKETMLIKVNIEGSALLVKLPDKHRRVTWLTQETIKRYYEMKKVRPVLRLTTKDGALLSPDDLICEVIRDNEVNAKLESFQVVPLSSRYLEECQNGDLLPLGDLEQELEAAEESGILSLANGNLSSKQMKALQDSISGTSLIRAIDLSFTWLSHSRQFYEALSSLAKLDELNLRGTGLTRTALNVLSRQKMSITQLDLSYNALTPNCTGLLAEIVSNNAALNSLSLICCDLTVQDLKQESLVKSVRSSKLNRLSLDKFIAEDRTIIELYDSRLDSAELGAGVVKI
ncbi:Tonsoku-like protein [Halotydeus destructor]|nr:Tonsoku-like protein [Halotydeus destructor]